MSDLETVTLYRLQACPFCERVVRRLQDYDVPYRSRFVEARHSRRDVVKRVSGKRTVPAIEDPNTGATLTESANIASYLDATYGPDATAPPRRRAATDGADDGGATDATDTAGAGDGGD